LDDESLHTTFLTFFHNCSFLRKEISSYAWMLS
jgi:hypothetical protein